MRLVTLEDKLAEESKRIVRNARRLHKRMHLDYPVYLSRNGLTKEIDIVNSPLEAIEDYIDRNKSKGRFYMIGIKDLNPRRIIVHSFMDFIYSIIFYRAVASLGDVKIKKTIYRKLGMNIGKNVHIYQGAKFDTLFAKLIEIGDNSTIGGEAQMYNHSTVASKDYFGWGIVKIGKNCTIGNHSLIAGINMGDGSSLKPSTVTAGYLFNIPKNAVYGGNPAKLLKIFGR